MAVAFQHLTIHNIALQDIDELADVLIYVVLCRQKTRHISLVELV